MNRRVGTRAHDAGRGKAGGQEIPQLCCFPPPPSIHFAVQVLCSSRVLVCLSFVASIPGSSAVCLPHIPLAQMTWHLISLRCSGGSKEPFFKGTLLVVVPAFCCCRKPSIFHAAAAGGSQTCQSSFAHCIHGFATEDTIVPPLLRATAVTNRALALNSPHF